MALREQTRLSRVCNSACSLVDAILTHTVVSRAFQILSDADKKAQYDRFGGDPDSRSGGGGPSASSPFSGFARSPGTGPMYEDEISPEELFNRFFGGGGFGGPFGMSTYFTGSLGQARANKCRWRLRWTSIRVQHGRRSWFYGTSDGWRSTSTETSNWRRTNTHRNLCSYATTATATPLHPSTSVLLLQRIHINWTQCTI
jgi:hypothetical protein